MGHCHFVTIISRKNDDRRPAVETMIRVVAQLRFPVATRAAAATLASPVAPHRSCWFSTDKQPQHAFAVQERLPPQNGEDGGNKNNSNNKNMLFRPVYVHQVSKMVLQHLQDSRSQWLKEQGLHRGLTINPNGTFVLQFPTKQGYDAGRIWTSYDKSTKQHWLSMYRGKFVGRFLIKDATISAAATSIIRKQPLQQQGGGGGSSWTESQQQQQQPQSVAQLEEHIAAVVDQMILSLSPPSD